MACCRSGSCKGCACVKAKKKICENCLPGKQGNCANCANSPNANGVVSTSTSFSQPVSRYSTMVNVTTLVAPATRSTGPDPDLGNSANSSTANGVASISTSQPEPRDSTMAMPPPSWRLLFYLQAGHPPTPTLSILHYRRFPP